MKKSFLKILLTLIFIIPCAIFLTACGEKEPEEYKINFELNGGVMYNDDSMIFKEGEDINLILSIQPEREGYVFDAWYSSISFEENSEITQDTVISSDMTLYARWVEKIYNINIRQTTSSNLEIANEYSFSVSYTNFDLNNINMNVEGYVFEGVQFDDFTSWIINQNGEFNSNVVYENETYTDSQGKWIYNGENESTIYLCSIFVGKKTNLLFDDETFYELEFGVNFDRDFFVPYIPSKEGYILEGLYFNEQKTSRFLNSDGTIADLNDSNSQYLASPTIYGSYCSWGYVQTEEVETLELFASWIPKTYDTLALQGDNNSIDGVYSLSFTYDSNEVLIYKDSEKVSSVLCNVGKFFEGIYVDYDKTTQLIDKDGKLNKNVVYDGEIYTDSEGNWIYDTNSIVLYVKCGTYSTTLILPDEDDNLENNAVITIPYGYVNYIELPEEYVLPTKEGYDLIGFKIENTDDKIISIKDIEYRSISLEYIDGYYESNNWIHCANGNTEIVLEPVWKAQEYNIMLFKSTEDVYSTASISVTYDSAIINPSKTSELTNSLEKEGYTLKGFKIQIGDDYSTLINVDELGEMTFVDNLTGYIENGIWIKDLSSIEGFYKLSLYAMFEPNKTIITITSEDDEVVLNTTEISIYYDSSELCEGEFTLATKNNYRLKGYALSVDAEEVLINSDYSLNNLSSYISNGVWIYDQQSLVLYPVFEPNVTTLKLHQIYYSNQESENVREDTIKYNENKEISFTTTNTGFTFVGYFTEEGGNGIKIVDKNGQLISNVDSYTDENANWIYSTNGGVGDNEIILYANWQPKEFTLTIDYSTEGGEGPTEITVTFNSYLVEGFTVPTKEGYSFKGFVTSSYQEVIGTDGSLLNCNYTTLDESSSKYVWIEALTLPKLKPWWQKNTTEVTFDYNYESGSDLPIKNLSYGDIEIPYDYTINTLRNGYTFVGFTYVKDDLSTMVFDENLDIVKGIEGYTNEEGKWIFCKDNSNQLTLYAYWTLIETGV